ncbi:MAG: aminoacetone oxidase family FAD-binding enzyme, partial [Clostridia bacterium]|nr:aminoacetone oxidase family FAD-binding enzyme [Clostridia bacterium]
NLTNASSVENVLNNVATNPKFLFPAINGFSPEDTVSFFTDYGLKLKTERGNRVFPESDRASDVTKTLEKALKKSGVNVFLNTTVKSVETVDGKVVGVNTDSGKFEADSVIVATGGFSYRATGSTGDGYVFAKDTGHKVETLRPALVGIENRNDNLTSASGLTLKNVKKKKKRGEKTLFNELGELLITEYGISGPLALSCSSVINKEDLNNVKMFIDFKCGLDENKLSARIERDFGEFPYLTLKEILVKMLPKQVVSAVICKASLSGSKRVSDVNTEEKAKLISVLKGYKLLPKSLRPIDEGIVTCGGVSVKEISPETMESKLIKGLFFACEVIDVDAFTGGFNIQIALSTGRLAGLNA